MADFQEPAIDSLRIPLDDIKLATNNFANDNFIGQGGFGRVYKGQLKTSSGEPGTLVLICPGESYIRPFLAGVHGSEALADSTVFPHYQSLKWIIRNFILYLADMISPGFHSHGIPAAVPTYRSGPLFILRKDFYVRSVYSVGCGLGRKIGHGTKNDEKQPRLIEQFQTLNLQPMVVAAAAWHAAVVGRDGRVRTWGWGRYGCFGHGNEDCDSVPKVVESLSNVKVVHVATGDYTIFVVSNDGDVYTFGCGESSSLGHNTAEVDAQRKVVLKVNLYVFAALLLCSCALSLAGQGLEIRQVAEVFLCRLEIDARWITSLDCEYRANKRAWMTGLLFEEYVRCNEDISKKIPLWIIAWRIVQQEAIANCFRHCKIRSANPTDSSDLNDGNYGEHIRELKNLITGMHYCQKMTVNHLVDYPCENNKCYEVQSIEEIVANTIQNSVDDEVEDDSIALEPVTRKEALQAATTLHNFFLQYEKTMPHS
ncbi:ultraviolet-B receptor UVR8 [Tanacetum coccineum]